MRTSRAVAAAALILAAAAVEAPAQTTRVASDFELREMERLAAAGGDFTSQVEARLNLGELRTERNEPLLAAREFAQVLSLAESTRRDARSSGEISLYATATIYAAAAHARLGHRDRAFELAEEATRYSGTHPRIWNIAANTMSKIGQPAKAVGAARNAVLLAGKRYSEKQNATNGLDLAVARFTLATALVDAGDSDEATRILEASLAALQSPLFAKIRKHVARTEAFEIYTTVRTDTEAYVAVRERTELNLAALYEAAGRVADARRAYREVLDVRNDDRVALEALARLAPTDDERRRILAQALDANPFSVTAIEAYRSFLDNRGVSPAAMTEEGPGALVRRTLEALHAHEYRTARITTDRLAAAYPHNDTVQYLGALADIGVGDFARARSRTIDNRQLRREIAHSLAAAEAPVPSWLAAGVASAVPTHDELAALLAILGQERLTPEQRAALDTVVLTSRVRFEARAEAAAPDQSVFERGTIGSIPFRFAQPTAFRGAFAATDQLQLDYRVLGATEIGGTPALLLEPVKLERPQ